MEKALSLSTAEEQRVLDDAIKTPERKKEFKLSTRQIAYIAVLVALSIVVNVFAPRTSTTKIGFTYTIYFIAGYYLGPICGALSGVLGDLLGTIQAGYAPNPLITVSAAIWGLVPGLVKKIKIKPFLQIIVSFIICFVVGTMFVNTYALWVMNSKGRTFWAYLVVRLVSQSPVIALNCALVEVLEPVFRKIFKYSTF